MDIQGLKDKILQLAIQGKLVEQDKNDEASSVLVEKIKKEREKLVQEKKIRKEKLLPKITEEEIPFEIPKGWTVIRYGDIAQYRKGPFGSSITKSMFVPKSETTAKIYEQKNAIQKDINLGDYYITAEKFKELESFELQPGDIIVSCAGTIGETFITPSDIEKGIINQALMKITLSQYVDKRFYLMYFNYILNTQITNVSKGSAIKNIPPLKHLKNIVFPLPSLQEQKRIVEKADQLFMLIDELGSNKADLLDTINLTRNQVLQEAIQGKLVEQNKDDEPATMLLEKIRKEKDKLIREKKIRKEKSLPEITEKEKPFNIPSGWEWVRLGDIINLISGRDLPVANCNEEGNGIPYIMGASNINNGKLLIQRWIDKPQVIAKKDDLIITVKGTVGKIILLKDYDEVNLSRQVMGIRQIHSEFPNYLYYFIESHLSTIINKSQGVIPGISREDILGIMFPFPPIAEQKRIVKK